MGKKYRQRCKKCHGNLKRIRKWYQFSDTTLKCQNCGHEQFSLDHAKRKAFGLKF